MTTAAVPIDESAVPPAARWQRRDDAIVTLFVDQTITQLSERLGRLEAEFPLVRRALEAEFAAGRP